MIHVGAGWLGHEKKDALALVGSGRVGGTVARSHVFASKGAFSTFVYIQGSVLGHWPDDLHSYITCSHLELLSLSVEREFPSGAERSIRLSDWLSRPPSHADTRVEEGCFFFFFRWRVAFISAVNILGRQHHVLRSLVQFMAP